MPDRLEPARLPSIGTLDRVPAAALSAALGPLFESAPRFLERLAAARPFGSWDALYAAAEAIALAMPDPDQRELLDAHPRIGADPSSVSALSFREQGYDREAADRAAEQAAAELARELARLNDAYEARFGFRYVIFVAGRPRAAIVPLLTAAIDGDPLAERERGLRDVVHIGRARAARIGYEQEGVG